MKRLFSLIIVLFAGVAGFAQENPKAAPEATVVCGNARFTVLTDRLVRMEWAADGKFEDRCPCRISRPTGRAKE